MEKIHFDYKMTIKYSEFTRLCYFSFKCIPMDTKRQKLLKYRINIEPSVQVSNCTDSFGNRKLYGTIKGLHSYMEYDIEGEAEIDQILYEAEVDKESLGMYKFPYGKNKSGKNIEGFYKKIISLEDFADVKTDYEKAIYIMKQLHKTFEYEKGVTSIETDAEEAFSLQKGVCQDYAHIYIALLHLANIPARYVTGMMIGEGESHAWVEFVWREKWIGVDPTNNLLIDNNYIKLANGRDALDCEINRGIIFGGGEQTLTTSVRVWKEENK